MLDNEIKEQCVFGIVLLVIFLGVVVFLLNVVVIWLVGMQCEQIVVFKVLGYVNVVIVVYYFKLVMVIVVVGLVLGLVLGDWLGGLLMGLYVEFFYFFCFEYCLVVFLVLVSVGIMVGIVVLGMLSVIFVMVCLVFVEVMCLLVLGCYWCMLLECLGVQVMGLVLCMMVCNMECWLLCVVLVVGGVVVVVVIIILGNYFCDVMEVIIDMQFMLFLCGDIIVWSIDFGDVVCVWLELGWLFGVVVVEMMCFVLVVFSFGYCSECVLVWGFVLWFEFYWVIDVDNCQILLEGCGLLLIDCLVVKLGVKLGDWVWVEVLEGELWCVEFEVGGMVCDMMGLNVYIDCDVFNCVLGDGDFGVGQVLVVECGCEVEVLVVMQCLLCVVGVFSKVMMVCNM